MTKEGYSVAQECGMAAATDQSNDGGPAFACAAENGHQPGMSLRDYFAAAALPALIRRFGIMDEPANAVAAEQAYQVADAMLAERTKAGTP